MVKAERHSKTWRSGEGLSNARKRPGVRQSSAALGDEWALQTDGLVHSKGPAQNQSCTGAQHSKTWRSYNALVLILSLLLPAALLPRAQAESVRPFRNLRESRLELEYPGSDASPTNLSEIRIGWFGPSTELTNADTTGIGMWQAANLALREANERGGCGGLPFRLVPCWSSDPWGSGVALLARMVYEEKPVAILGSVDSATTHLAEQVVAKANLTLVSPVATDPSVTLAGVSWMFSCAPSDDSIARLMAGEILAASAKGGSRLATLSATDHESRMTARALAKELSRRGCGPAFRFEVKPGAKDFDVEASMDALAKAQPSTIAIIASAEDSAALLSAVRKHLPDVPVFGGPACQRPAFLKLAGAAAEGVLFPRLAAAEDYTAALTYDATRLLLEAIRIAGTDRGRIRESLHALSPWKGLAGEIRFDGTGQNTRAVTTMGTVRNGRVVPLAQSIISEQPRCCNANP